MEKLRNDLEVIHFVWCMTKALRAVMKSEHRHLLGFTFNSTEDGFILATIGHPHRLKARSDKKSDFSSSMIFSGSNVIETTNNFIAFLEKGGECQTFISISGYQFYVDFHYHNKWILNNVSNEHRPFNPSYGE